MTHAEPAPEGRKAEVAAAAADGQAPDSLAALGEVLTWAKPPGRAIECLENRYVKVLGARLGEVLASACAADARLGSALVARVQALDEGSLRALLLAPATSRRLVTRLHAPQDVLRHLAAVLGLSQVPAAEPARTRHIAGLETACEPPGDARLASVCDRAAHALDSVAAGCAPAATFVRRVMRRLVMRIDPAREGFASNSPQGYVGLAVLTNPHLPLVDDVVLAEALVHESIHGFVGMSEAIGIAGNLADERWVDDERVYEGASCTISPWTGKALDLPTYLHACFVWWGLLNLWAALAGQGLFDERRLRSRLARAARGFRDGALVRELQPHLRIVHPALLAAFAAMAQEVDTLLCETGLDMLLGRLDAVAPSP